MRTAHFYMHMVSSHLSFLWTNTDLVRLAILVLVTGQLSNEIMEIIAEIGRLFGVLSEDVVQLA